MARKMFTEAELAAALISPRHHGWFSHYAINTRGGRREVVRRRSGEVHACKVLPLIIDDVRLERALPHGHCSLETLRKSVLKVGIEHLSVPFLAADRPITYFRSELRLHENWVIELPGGVVEHDEEITIGGVRELLEELGLAKDQVLSYAKLLPHPAAWDSGSHVEWTQLTVALCSGGLRLENKEGILPEHCRTVRLAEADHFLRRMDERGIGIEGYCYTALDALFRTLVGGWDQLH